MLSPSEDIANARLRFANGCVANITASRISPERMRSDPGVQCRPRAVYTLDNVPRKIVHRLAHSDRTGKLPCQETPVGQRFRPQ